MQLQTILIISLKVLRIVSCSTVILSTLLILTPDLKTICQLGFICHKAVWSESYFLLLQKANAIQ